MLINFRPSKLPTLGVEIELQIVEPDTRKLEPRAGQLLERCRQRNIERVKAEIHQSMLEVDTEVSDDVKECYGHLASRLQQLTAVSQELGVNLCTGATHPFGHWRDSKVFPSDRYLSVSEKFQWLAKRVTVYGMHVHVGVPSGDAAISVINGAIPYLPQLLALSANSPFWQGIDTGLQSCRIGVMDSFPFSGVPKPFSNWEGFEEYCRLLIDTGAIESMKDIYWHVRPNATFGTVEFRICDTLPTLDEAIALVAYIQCLVVFLIEDYHNGGPSLDERVYWLAPENQWIAARDGLEGMLVSPDSGKKRVKIRDAVAKTLEMLAPTAKRLGCLAELDRVNGILKSGNGALRQRAVYKKTGKMESVVDALIHEYQTNQPLTLDSNDELLSSKEYLFVQ